MGINCSRQGLRCLLGGMNSLGLEVEIEALHLLSHNLFEVGPPLY